MDLTKLITLYPNAQKKNSPASDKGILSLAIDDYFLWIDQSTISTQETNLLKALFPVATVEDNHPWYHYLFENKPLVAEESFRMIQFHIDPRGEFLKRQWQETIGEMFFHLEDFFFYTETDAVLIEKKCPSYLEISELRGIFLSLDADFEITTQVFIGSFHLPSPNFSELFFEERKIFFEEKKHFALHGGAISLSEVALHHYTKGTMNNNQLIASYQEMVKRTEMEEIISVLWKNLGNISSTAKSLFLHRNTLKYKIEKFQEQTGFNLKEANDLLFCHLLLLQEQTH
ncbi:helix-turn-helix domain-containing protein [Enterococcus hirae]|uniref:helix-turn-helix domain-containing protein n=1 Tax=Enterococcus hirae TaxID=1354 RepID=UPI001376BB9E|nr:helix-turn-helix domain-containing protein [Enterococcus hirae]MCK6146321.1 helix-turn-helix domain-containing protein [Enterococcus hirae]MCK6174046.1 helix-turn-helix domain-containing protein [Enterococcus hirae]NBA17789.1 Fis family transcriptional regulator [Enterococcus hirae]